MRRVAVGGRRGARANAASLPAAVVVALLAATARQLRPTPAPAESALPVLQGASARRVQAAARPAEPFVAAAVAA